MECTILIPMAGQGSRFRDVGFLQFKPVIDIGGRPMISWVIDNILPKSFDLKAKVVVVVRRDQGQLESVTKQLCDTVPNLEVVYADQTTEGAACTCLLARHHIDNLRPLLIINSDQYIDWNDAGDSTDYWRQVEHEAKQGFDANILCFKRAMELGDTKWSYAAMDSEGFVHTVREKEVISDNATVGAYYWQRGADFVSSADEMIARNIRVNGEFYVAPAYNINIERGQRIKLAFCRRLWGLGVPADLVEFLSGHLRHRRMLHTATMLGCSEEDLEPLRSRLSVDLPASDICVLSRDASRAAGKDEEAAQDGNPMQDRGGFVAEPGDSEAELKGGGGGDGTAVLGMMRNLERIKFIVRHNEPAAIERVISEGLDVQVGVWYLEWGKAQPSQSTSAAATTEAQSSPQYYLGLDAPLYRVSLSFLEKYAGRMWLECGDTSTLCHFAGLPQLQSFAKSPCEVVLTSHKVLWAPAGQAHKVPAADSSTAVVCVDDAAGGTRLLGQALLAICGEDEHVRQVRLERQRRLRAAHVCMCCPVLPQQMTGWGYRRIKLIVFDLDGVLVESQHLHFCAMNKALAAVAGDVFCISDEEHALVFDGLSTQQKLNLLSSAKGLPEHLHDAVWQKKQELTRLLVKETIPRNEELVHALQEIKCAGFPVAVASNCIRESVVALLSAVGVLHLIDAIFSNEDVGHPKPNGDMYELVARSFGDLDPRHVAVFEDSKRGFEAVVRARCNLFRVNSPRDVSAEKVLARVLSFEACTMVEPLVTVVVPMAGSHPTVWTAGPDRPKEEVPVIFSDVRGRPALYWAVQSLQPLPKRVHFIFVVRRSLAKSAGCALLRILPWCVDYCSMSILVLDKPTRGAAQSVLEAQHLLNHESPLAIFDGNHQLLWPATCPGLSHLFSSMRLDDRPKPPLCGEHDGCDAGHVRAECGGARGAGVGAGGMDAVVTVFRDRDPRCSYVQLAPGSPSQVVAVKEKIQVSDMACSGLYCFRRAGDFVAAARAWHARPHDNAQVHSTRYYVAPVLDFMIATGKRVAAVPLAGCSSLRSHAELKPFADAVFAQVGAPEQRNIYRDMRVRNAARIANSGFAPDELLQRTPDTRRCLAAYVMANESNFIPSPCLARLLSQLPESLHPHVVYSQALHAEQDHNNHGALHWTLMQLVGFNMYDKTQLPEDYTEVLETLLQQLMTPFEIHFNSLILTPSNLVLVGHPTIDVNHVRESVRAGLRELGYPLYEPYKTDILHMTLVRFSEPVTPQQHAMLEQFVATAENESYSALLRVECLSVSPASWKMTPAELAVHQSSLVALSLP